MLLSACPPNQQIFQIRCQIHSSGSNYYKMNYKFLKFCATDEKVLLIIHIQCLDVYQFMLAMLHQSILRHYSKGQEEKKCKNQIIRIVSNCFLIFYPIHIILLSLAHAFCNYQFSFSISIEQKCCTCLSAPRYPIFHLLFFLRK